MGEAKKDQWDHVFIENPRCSKPTGDLFFLIIIIYVHHHLRASPIQPFGLVSHRYPLFYLFNSQP